MKLCMTHQGLFDDSPSLHGFSITALDICGRQKTAGQKTDCSCGRGTGIWCGSCLNTRMGQNIDEVFHMSDWKCPSCLEICNCSGRTCDRHNANLGCTRILSGEAREQGYRSVSLLLIACMSSKKKIFKISCTHGQAHTATTSETCLYRGLALKSCHCFHGETLPRCGQDQSRDKGSGHLCKTQNFCRLHTTSSRHIWRGDMALRPHWRLDPL